MALLSCSADLQRKCKIIKEGLSPFGTTDSRALELFLFSFGMSIAANQLEIGECFSRNHETCGFNPKTWLKLNATEKDLLLKEIVPLNLREL